MCDNLNKEIVPDCTKEFEERCFLKPNQLEMNPKVQLKRMEDGEIEDHVNGNVNFKDPNQLKRLTSKQLFVQVKRMEDNDIAKYLAGNGDFKDPKLESLPPKMVFVQLKRMNDDEIEKYVSGNVHFGESSQSESEKKCTYVLKTKKITAADIKKRLSKRPAHKFKKHLSKEKKISKFGLRRPKVN